MRQIEETRDIIVQHIIGDARVSANSSTFQHVPLPKLVQVLLRRPSESKSIKDVHCLSEKPKQMAIPERTKKEGKEKIPLHIKLREKQMMVIKKEKDRLTHVWHYRSRFTK